MTTRTRRSLLLASLLATSATAFAQPKAPAAPAPAPAPAARPAPQPAEDTFEKELDTLFSASGLTADQAAATHTLQLQLERCLATGELDADGVREVALHLIPYVGYPSASELFRVAETAVAAAG